MRILFLDWNCFNGEATKKAMKEQGHVVLPFFHKKYDALESDEFCECFEKYVKENRPSVIFSYNYFPLVAQCCHDKNLPYVSVVYDNPAVYLYSYTLMYPTNHVYIFDSKWVREFNAGGLSNVHYITLPADTERLPRLEASSEKKYACDISFVGALYNEQHNFYDRMKGNLSERMEGFLEGLMDAQMLVYGSDLIGPVIRGDVLDEIRKALPVYPERGFVEPDNYRVLKYVIGRKLTSKERIRYLTALGDKYKIDLYTLDDSASIPGVINHGTADYIDVMPFVFNQSRINLNITLRSIDTGIPQRCMDIMGCGGFLLSNYQADFFLDAVTEDGSAAFAPGVDFDFYSSSEELLDKVGYYLSHEDERAQIARNGYEKVKKFYSIDKFLHRVLDEFV